MHHSNTEYLPVYREPSHYNPLDTFRLPSGNEKHYQQQYGDMYFIRLARLKPAVEQVAADAWDGFSVCCVHSGWLIHSFFSVDCELLADWDQIAGERARRVDRVLDVRQGELCYVSGTVFMDMPLKPNILDDVSKEVFTRLLGVATCYCF